MYKIIGSDQKVYGPVSLDQIRQWQAEGRVNGATLVQAEGSNEWKPFSSLTESSVPPPVSMPPTPTIKRGNGAATAGLVFGILCNVLGSSNLFAILGIIFSVVGISKYEARPQIGGKGMALWGLILSIIGFGIRDFVPFYWFPHHWRHW